MPRPRLPPHLVWSDDRGGTWCVVDGRTRIRLGLARGEAGAAQLRLAEYVVEQARKTPEPEQDRPASRVSVAEVLERYLIRRTDDDPAVRRKVVARPRELAQRVTRLMEWFGDRPCSWVTEASCEGFVEHCGSASYARRCLGDLQAALNEGRRAALFREAIQVTLPPPPAAREDHLTFAEAVALVRVCLRHRDVQQRRTIEGLRLVQGTARPWAHVARFIIVAIATCSRSSRVYEASYSPEEGRPWVDMKRGVLYRQAPGTRQTKKRAPTVDLSPRLVAAMRRWSSDRVVNGREVKGDRYVVEFRGRPVDPKKAFGLAVDEAMRLHPDLFMRDDGTPKTVVRHTLRHTGVTWLAETPGVDVEDVCSYAGMTRAMFDRVYGHAHRARSRKIVQAQTKKPRKRKKED